MMAQDVREEIAAEALQALGMIHLPEAATSGQFAIPAGTKEGTVKVRVIDMVTDLVSKEAHLEVLDVYGRQLYFEQLNATGWIQLEVATEAWENGLYLVRLTDGTAYKTTKLLIER